MTDIVKRLEKKYADGAGGGKIILEAKEEIERLRIALTDINSGSHSLGDCWLIARKALGERE